MTGQIEECQIEECQIKECQIEECQIEEWLPGSSTMSVSFRLEEER